MSHQEHTAVEDFKYGLHPKALYIIGAQAVSLFGLFLYILSVELSSGRSSPIGQLWILIVFIFYGIPLFASTGLIGIFYSKRLRQMGYARSAKILHRSSFLSATLFVPALILNILLSVFVYPIH